MIDVELFANNCHFAPTVSNDFTLYYKYFNSLIKCQDHPETDTSVGQASQSKRSEGVFMVDGREVLYYENFDLENVVSPVDASKLEQLLKEANHDKNKTEFLVEGFRNGFSIGYEGDPDVQLTAPNLKLNIGDSTELWNKVMKEVKLGRYAGPYENIPLDKFIQSPIGLVPKDNGTKTRLIFHLSYPKDGTTSLNFNTPKQLCRVKYCEFDQAVKRCIEEGVGCSMAKSDMSSAFRNLGIKKEHWAYLIMKAKSPFDGKTYYFVDKCLPFGASISCAHFQEFSNAVAYLVKCRTSKRSINYLDDYFFAALYKMLCDQQVQSFIDLCNEIRFPVSMEKTVWGTTQITFLGMLLDSIRQIVAIPDEKVLKAKVLIGGILSKKKVTVHKLQSLCGFLNFLGRSVVPGRTFTRRLYAAYSNDNKLKSHHHIRVNGEMKLDLQTWLVFLEHPSVYCRKFIDFTPRSAEDISFFTDASKTIGFGGICGSDWMYETWNTDFIKKEGPSISFLELYAVAVGILCWIPRFKDKCIVLHCDNQGAVEMINSSTSKCKQCMKLIRVITLQGLIHNVKINAKHVKGSSNELADFLSRGIINAFKNLAKEKGIILNKYRTAIPDQLWPIEKFWADTFLKLCQEKRKFKHNMNS